MLICHSYFSLGQYIQFFNPWRNHCLKIKQKNNLRALQAILLNKNIPLSSNPINPAKHMPKVFEQKQYLAGDVWQKMFHPNLMDKLIRIEWVSVIKLPQLPLYSWMMCYYNVHEQKCLTLDWLWCNYTRTWVIPF